MDNIFSTNMSTSERGFNLRSWVASFFASTTANNYATETSICIICVDKSVQSGEQLSTSCRHEPNVCRDCLTRYATEELEKVVTEVRCPVTNCGTVLDHSEVGEIVPGQVFAWYNEMLFKRCMEKDAEFRWCSAPGCENRLLNVSSVTSFLTWVNCGTKTCFSSRNKSHEGLK